MKTDNYHEKESFPIQMPVNTGEGWGDFERNEKDMSKKYVFPNNEYETEVMQRSPSLFAEDSIAKLHVEIEDTDNGLVFNTLAVTDIEGDIDTERLELIRKLLNMIYAGVHFDEVTTGYRKRLMLKDISKTLGIPDLTSMEAVMENLRFDDWCGLKHAVNSEDDTWDGSPMAYCTCTVIAINPDESHTEGESMFFNSLISKMNGKYESPVTVYINPEDVRKMLFPEEC